NYDHGGARERGNRIEVTAEHRWNLRREHVAHHAAADPGQHAQEYRGHRPQMKVERLLRASDREKREARRVEELHGTMNAIEEPAPEKSCEACHCGNGDVPPVGDPGWGDRTNQQIAED